MSPDPPTPAFAPETIEIGPQHTKSLDALIGALSDTIIGERPELFFNRKRRRGQPVPEALRRVRCASAACLDLMIDEGMPKAEAVRRVVNLLKQHGIKRLKTDGSSTAIMASDIVGWRYELRRTSAGMKNYQYTIQKDWSRRFLSCLKSQGRHDALNLATEALIKHLVVEVAAFGNRGRSSPK